MPFNVQPKDFGSKDLALDVIDERGDRLDVAASKDKSVAVVELNHCSSSPHGIPGLKKCCHTVYRHHTGQSSEAMKSSVVVKCGLEILARPSIGVFEYSIKAKQGHSQ